MGTVLVKKVSFLKILLSLSFTMMYSFGYFTLELSAYRSLHITQSKRFSVTLSVYMAHDYLFT